MKSSRRTRRPTATAESPAPLIVVLAILVGCGTVAHDDEADAPVRDEYFVVATEERAGDVGEPFTLRVVDESGRPVAGRRFSVPESTYGFFSPLTDDDGRAFFRVENAGDIHVDDHGRMPPETTIAFRYGSRPSMSLKRRRSSESMAILRATVDGVDVALWHDNGFEARAPGAAVVTMRRIPLACVRAVDTAGKPVAGASVEVDVGIAGVEPRFWLDEGHTDLDGTAWVEVPCDGEKFAWDAPLTTIRWRLRGPNGLDEHAVETPADPNARLLDAGTVTLPSQRSVRLRFVGAEGASPQVGAVTAIERAGAPFGAYRDDVGSTVLEWDDFLVHLRPTDGAVRLFRSTAFDPQPGYLDVEIDPCAAAPDGPGQVVDCSRWIPCPPLPPRDANAASSDNSKPEAPPTKSIEPSPEAVAGSPEPGTTHPPAVQPVTWCGPRFPVALYWRLRVYRIEDGRLCDERWGDAKPNGLPGADAPLDLPPGRYCAALEGEFRRAAVEGPHLRREATFEVVAKAPASFVFPQ